MPIVGDYPILQNVRKEAPTLTFTGQWFNYVATGDRVQNLEDLGNEGEPLAVTGDTGFFYGFWVIQSLREVRRRFFVPVSIPQSKRSGRFRSSSLVIRKREGNDEHSGDS